MSVNMVVKIFFLKVLLFVNFLLLCFKKLRDGYDSIIKCYGIDNLGIFLKFWYR